MHRIPQRLSLSVSCLVSLWATALYADNPIIQTKYTADPAPMVHDGTVYLYTSHDEDNASGFTMYNYMLYTSTDMVNWTDHGILAGVKDPYKTWKWADGSNAWAPQVIFRNNKFYMYAPFPKGGRMTIGVAVADKPTGPFVDAIGKPLIDDPTSNGLDIDPTVFIDTDGQAYLYFGHQPYFYYVKLSEDMISYSGDIVRYNKIGTFEEGPWLWAVEDRWYLGWASTCCPEGIGYAMSDKPTGPWTYKGSIMDGDSRSSGNHPGIIQFKGTWYVFGFNYAISYPQTTTQPLPGGHTEQRSICVEKFTYAADGTIPKLPWWTTTGAPQIGTLDPYGQTEAETIAFSKGLKTETCGEGGMDVTDINNGEYIKVKGVDFGEGATSLDVRVASAGSGGNIEVRLDSQTGKLVGTCAVAGTGGGQTLGTGSLFNFNWWKFSGSGPSADAGVGGDGGSASGGSGGTAGTQTATAGTGGRGGQSTNGGNSSTAAGGKGGQSSADTTGPGGSGRGGRSDTDSGGTGGVAGGGTRGRNNSGGAAGSVSSSARGGGSSDLTSASSARAVGGSTSVLSGGSSSASTSDARTNSSGCSCRLGASSGDPRARLGLLIVLAFVALRRTRR